MKNSLILFVIGFAFILFWYFTKDTLPFGKYPGVIGIMIIFKGIIDLTKK